MQGRTTEQLNNVLKSARPEKAEAYFEKHADKLAEEERPFAAYVRERIREKGLTQQEIFLKADISEGFGYKLISQEKHTRQRDIILRLLLAAGFSVDETDRALKLYGMSPLYARVKRDAVLIMAINHGIREVEKVNEYLEKYGMEPLYSSQEEA